MCSCLGWMPLLFQFSDSIRECGCQKRVVTRTALKPSLAITWFVKGHGPSNVQTGDSQDNGWMKVCCPDSLFPPPLLQQQETQGRGGFCTGLSCLVSVPTLSWHTVFLHFPRAGESWTCLLLLAAKMRITCLFHLAACQMRHPQTQCAKRGF